MELAVGGPAKLARAAGVTSAAVAQWKKTGKPEQLKAAPLLMLQRATGIRADWVVFGRGPMKSRNFVEVETSDLVESLAAAAADLSDTERAALGDTISQWVRKADPSDRLAAAIRVLLAPASSSGKQALGTGTNGRR